MIYVLAVFAVLFLVLGLALVFAGEFAGLFMALVGAGGLLFVVLTLTGNACSELNCRYADVSPQRVNAACRERGGVAKWGGDVDYVCKDGTAGILRTGYYHPGHPFTP